MNKIILFVIFALLLTSCNQKSDAGGSLSSTTASTPTDAVVLVVPKEQGVVAEELLFEPSYIPSSIAFHFTNNEGASIIRTGSAHSIGFGGINSMRTEERSEIMAQSPYETTIFFDYETQEELVEYKTLRASEGYACLNYVGSNQYGIFFESMGTVHQYHYDTKEITPLDIDFDATDVKVAKDYLILSDKDSEYRILDLKANTLSATISDCKLTTVIRGNQLGILTDDGTDYSKNFEFLIKDLSTEQNNVAIEIPKNLFSERGILNFDFNDKWLLISAKKDSSVLSDVNTYLYNRETHELTCINRNDQFVMWQPTLMDETQFAFRYLAPDRNQLCIYDISKERYTEIKNLTANNHESTIISIFPNINHNNQVFVCTSSGEMILLSDL